MNPLGRDRLQPDQNPSLRFLERGLYDALGHQSLLDDGLQDNERSLESLSESESDRLGQQLLAESRLSRPDGPDPGRADWFKEVGNLSVGQIEQRLLRREGLSLSADGMQVTGAFGTRDLGVDAYMDLQSWRRQLDRTVLQANRNAWTPEAVKADLMQRHLPGSVVPTMRSGLAFDGHLHRYMNILQGAQTDAYLGLFMAEHPALAAGALEAQDRNVQVTVRTNAAFNERGQAFARGVWSQFKNYSTAPSGMTDHYKFALGDMQDPRTARALLTSANATMAALGGGVRRDNSLVSMGANFESSVMFSAETFSDGAVWLSMHEQLQGMQRWVQSGETDLVEKLILDQRVSAALDLTKTEDIRQALRNAQNLMGSQLMDQFTGLQKTGASRILSGSGVAAAHRQMLQQLGQGGRAILVSYNFGQDISNEIEAAVRRGADVTLLHGSRWEFGQEGGPRLIHATEPKHNLDALQQRLADSPTPVAGKLTVVQNVSSLVHIKASVFEAPGQAGVFIPSTMNLDDNQLQGRYMETEYDGPIRNIGALLPEGEYIPYQESVRMLERLVKVSSLTRTLATGTQTLDSAVQQELARLRTEYGLTSYHASSVNLNKADDNHLSFKVGGTFRLGEGVGALHIDLGKIMDLTAYRPTQEAVSRGFGRSTTDLYVPQLSKFVNSVRGVGWATSDDPLVGDARTASGLEVLVAGIAAAQAQTQGYLNALVDLVGTDMAQQILRNPYEMGRLRFTIREFTKGRFKNFAGLEPGTPAYAAKQYAQLLMRVGSNGLLDLNSSIDLNAETLDKILAGELTRADLGGRNYLFTASGLSRFNRYGDAKTARMYDVEMLNTLPVADFDQQNDDFMFLMPIGKLAQLPQRLQNIISTRNLTPVVEQELLQLMGTDDPRERGLVGLSRFVGNRVRAADRKPVIRFRGYAVPGFSGDQNAYLMGDAFEHLYLGNESFRKTVKITSSTAIPTDMGRLLHEQLAGLADTADSGVHRLSGDRYFLNAQALDALEAKLDLAGHRIGDTGMHMLQQLDLGLAGKETAGVLLDLSKEGSGLVRTSSGWEFTLTGVPMERITSGSRNLLGAKVPFVMALRESRFFQGIDRLARAMYGDMPGGVYTGLNMQDFNIVFGMGTLKTGQVFVETGIEMLETGMYKTQLAYLRKAHSEGLAPLRQMQTVINKLASGVQNRTVRRELEAVGESLGKENFTDADFDAFERVLDRTADYLADSPNNLISLRGFGRRRHAAAAMLAFGLHASFSLTRLDKLSQSPKGHQLFDEVQMGALEARDGAGRLMREQLPDQLVFGTMYLSFTSSASALTTPMSSRNRVNLLAYHRSSTTQALYDMMARSEAMQGKMAAFEGLMAHGLLGAAGDMRFAEGPQIFSDYVPGLMIQHGGRQVDPYVALQDLQNRIEAEALHNRREAALVAQEQGRSMLGLMGVSAEEQAERMGRLQGLTQEIDEVHAKLRGAIAALRGDESAPDADRKWAYKSVGSAESSLTTRTLTAEIEAGVRTQTLLLPNVDPRNRGGQQVSYTPVQFLSREHLMSLGAFEDFAHDVIQLQAKAGQLLGRLGGIQRQGQVFMSTMSEHDSDVYDELMSTVGKLREAQRLAMTSGLQKLIGGMLALPGTNMVIGTLPEVELGTMVVSERAYQVMRTEAVSEMTASVEANVTLLREAAAQRGETLSRRQATAQALGLLLSGVNRELHGAVNGLQQMLLDQFEQGFTAENAYQEQIDELSLQRDQLTLEMDLYRQSIYGEGGIAAEWRAEKKQLERKAMRAARQLVGYNKAQTQLHAEHRAKQQQGRQAYQAQLRALNTAYESRLSALEADANDFYASELEPLTALEAQVNELTRVQVGRSKVIYATQLSQERLVRLRDRIAVRMQPSAEETSLRRDRSRLLRLAEQQKITSRLSTARHKMLQPLRELHGRQTPASAAQLRDALGRVRTRSSELDAREAQQRSRAERVTLDELQATNLSREQRDTLNDIEASLADLELARTEKMSAWLARKRRAHDLLMRGSVRLHGMKDLQASGADALRAEREALTALRDDARARHAAYKSLSAEARGIIDQDFGVVRRAADMQHAALRSREQQRFEQEKKALDAGYQDQLRAMRNRLLEGRQTALSDVTEEVFDRLTDLAELSGNSPDVLLGDFREVETLQETLQDRLLGAADVPLTADSKQLHLARQDTAVGQEHLKAYGVTLKPTMSPDSQLLGNPVSPPDAVAAQQARGIFNQADQERYEQIQREEQRVRDHLQGLRNQKNRLTAGIQQLRQARQGQGRTSVQQVLQSVLGALVDSNETVRAIFMRGGMQRAGAPVGPDAVLYSRVARQSELNQRNPNIRIDEALSTRGVFFNLGAMGFFLGDFDGDTGSIFNLADYTRLRTLALSGAPMSEEDARVYQDVEKRMRMGAAEQAWSFARHYTSLTEAFAPERFFSDLPGATGSLEQDREHFFRLVQRAEAEVLKLPNAPYSSLQAARMAIPDARQLGATLFGEGSAEAAQFAAFSDREKQATNLAESLNQYVAEMRETHNKFLEYSLDARHEGRNAREVYQSFFRREVGSKAFAASVAEFEKALKKASATVNDTSFKDGGTLNYNVLVGYFVQTSFASSQVISKAFEFSYTMQLASDMGYASDMARGLSQEVAGEARDLRQGTILMLQQMAREAIKPKDGGAQELGMLRTLLQGANRDTIVVRSINRIFERPRMKGLNWLSILSTGQTMLNERVDADAIAHRIALTAEPPTATPVGASPEAEAQLAPDATARPSWLERLVNLGVRTLEANADVPRDMTWEAVYDEVSTAVRDYHSGTVEAAFKNGTGLQLINLKEDQLAGMDAEERKTFIKTQTDSYLDRIVGRQTNLAIEMALSARGVQETLSTYRRGITSGDVNEVNQLSATMGLQERALGFYAIAARGKFVDADAVEAGMKNLFQDVDHLELPEAQERLRSVGREVTGASAYGDSLARIYGIVRTQGTDLQAAIYRSGAEERRVDAGERQQARRFAVANLAAINQGNAGDLDQLSDRQLFDRLSHHTGALHEHLEKNNQAHEIQRLQQTQNLLGFTGAMDHLAQGYQEKQAAAQQAAGQTSAQQQHRTAQVLDAALSNPHANNAIFNVGLGTVMGFGAAMMFAPPAMAAEQDTMEGLGSMLAATLAFSKPSTMYRQINRSNKEEKEKLGETAMLTAALVGGIGGAQLGTMAASQLADSVFNPEDERHSLRTQRHLRNKVRFAGGTGGAIGGAVGGTVAGLLAQGLLQRAFNIGPVNPMEQMMLGVAGFLPDNADEIQAGDEFVAEEEAGISVTGTLELVDEAGEYIDQTVWQVSWASFDDEHGFEAFGSLVEGDQDTYVSGINFEAYAAEADLPTEPF
jgi:hypothetical protein